MAETNPWRKRTLTLLKLLITALVVWFIIHRLGWRNIIDAVVRADRFWLVVAAAIFLISGIIGAAQWRLLLHNRKVNLPFRRVFLLYYIGMFFNNFMLGMVAGDAVKVALIRSRREDARAGLAATFLDRFAGLWAMLGFAMAGSAVLLMQGMLDESRLLTAVLGLGAAFLGFGLVCAFLVSRRVQKLSFQVLHALPIPAKASIEAMARGVALEVDDRHILAPVAGTAALIQFLRILVHVCCAQAMGLLTMGNFQYFFIFVPFLAILMLIPLPFGVKEGVGGTLFLLAGFSPEAPEEPVIMEFLASLTGIGVSMLGGLFFITNKLSHWKTAA
jgi:glycosyltransferase 2 family protein